MQNVGTSQTTVNIKLTVTNSSNPAAPIGNVYNDSETVDPGESTVFSKFRRDNLGGMPEGTFAAAVVTSAR